MAKEVKQLKTWQKVFFLIVIAAAIGFKLFSYHWPKATVSIGGQEIKVLVADTYDHELTGWSNKKDMGQYQGMLFYFSSRDQHAMVMRNMLFPLDIAWIDGNQIVDMASNLPPDNHPESQLYPYMSREPSTLVLELPAGFLQQNKVKIGDTIGVIY